LQSKLSDADRELAEDLDVTVHTVIASFPASQNKLAELRSATETDQVLSAVRLCIRDGIPTDTTWLQPEVKQILKSTAEIYDINGLLFLNNKLIVAQSLRKSILDIAHEGHLGVEKTKQLARSSVYWPGMGDDIERVINKCSVCQSFQRKQQHLPSSTRSCMAKARC